jgi:branched-chain amino acid transport system substrate-binding protein
LAGGECGLNKSRALRLSFGRSQVHVTIPQVLKQCWNDLSRENILKEAANINDLQLPMGLPGGTINTSPNNYSPIGQTQLSKFNGESWELFGDILSG